LEKEIRLYHFKELIDAVSEVLRVKPDVMGDEWVSDFVRRGTDWEKYLNEILSSEKIKAKAEFYEVICI